MNKSILGTAQLYDSYGINNISKKSKKKSLDILNFAKKNKYFDLDTARIYKQSEKIIGDFSELKNIKFNVITKIQPFDKNIISKKEKINFIKTSVEKSNFYLKKNNFHGLLIHDFNNFMSLGEDYMDIIINLKKKYKINYLGASIQNTSQIKNALIYNDLKILQIPFNILDNRWHKIINDKKNISKIFHARSIFLQGLLLKKSNYDISGYNSNYIKDLLDIIRKNNNYEEIKCLLINYVYSFKRINSFIFGIDNVSQFKEINKILLNLKLMNKKQLNQIEKNIPNIKHEFLNPAKWKDYAKK